MMSGCGRVSFLADDTTLPDDERVMLERARALIPLLAERAPAAAAARQLPAETIAEYHAAGILRILQPRRFGGMQGRFSLFSRIVEELTYGCASSACWPSISGSSPSIPSRRRSTSGARIPKPSPRPRWRRAKRPDACRAAGG
jgi:alkylation response protein AidB-like acyl-CoA dehydrogenase